MRFFVATTAIACLALHSNGVGATRGGYGYAHGVCSETEMILGEEAFTTNREAGKIARSHIRENLRLLSEKNTCGWQVAPTDPPLVVEYKPITGDWAPPGVSITRARAVFNNVTQTADEFFQFLTSPDGFVVIDPASDPADFGVPLTEFDWHHGSLQTERAEFAAEEGGPTTGEFIVLNAVHNRLRIFSSKSCLDEDVYGSSYLGPGPYDVELPRSLNTFSIKVDPVKDDENALLVQATQMTIIPGVPTSVLEGINVYAYMQGLYPRLAAAAQA